MTDKIAVYIMAQDPEQVCDLESAFDDDLFEVIVASVELPPSIDEEFIARNYRMQKLLEHAAKTFPGKPVLILDGTSATHASPTKIATIISEILQAPGWELAYLCKWLDRCDLYADGKVLSNGSTLFKTYSPFGLQVVLVRPSAQRKILDIATSSLKTAPLEVVLNQEIQEGKIHAICMSPNLFHIKSQELDRPSDFVRYNECRMTGPDTQDPEKDVEVLQAQRMALDLTDAMTEVDDSLITANPTPGPSTPRVEEIPISPRNVQVVQQSNTLFGMPTWLLILILLALILFAYLYFR